VTPDVEYSPERKAGLIEAILSSTAVVSDALSKLSPDLRRRLRSKVANVIAGSNTSLESVLDVYRAEVPGFASKWRDLEAPGPASSRRAAMEHILAERYGSKLK
jgi:hypothetical protein